MLQEINQENGVGIKRHNLLTKEQILNARACGAGVTAFNLTAEGFLATQAAEELISLLISKGVLSIPSESDYTNI